MGETDADLIFLMSLLVFCGVVVVAGAPLWLVALRRDRRLTIRNYGLAGLTVAVLCALVEVASRRAEAQCEAAGNPTCYDPGGPGLQIVMVGIYLIANWYVAYMLWKD